MNEQAARHRTPFARAALARSLALIASLSSLLASDGARSTGAATLAFEYAGCARVRPGPLCEFSAESQLTFWVAGTSAPVLEIDGADVSGSRRASFIEGGHRLQVRVPSGARRVRLRTGHGEGELRLAKDSAPAPLRALARAWDAGGSEDVRALIDDTVARLHGSERERARAFRARSALRAGENERAAAELESTAESAIRAGLLLEASDDFFAAAYCRAIRLGDYERSRALLDRVERDLASVPEARARLAYYRGVLATATGDTLGALIHYRRAGVLARRLGLEADELLARQELAVTLNELRRHAEALAEQEALVARAVDGPSCLLSLALENLAWMVSSQPEPALQPRATAALDRAEALFARCPDPRSRRNQALIRVELALSRRDVADAKRRLSALDADAAGSSTRLAAWQALYWGQLHLLEGAIAEALPAFELARQLAESVELKDCAYLARLGRARALARANDPEAVSAYSAAEDAADEIARWAPFGQGQQLTALQAQESSRELVSLLLDRGAADQAYRAAIRAAQRAWASSWRASRITALTGPSKQRWERAVAEYRARRRDFESLASDDWKLSLAGLAAVRFSRALERQRLDNALAEAYAVISKDEDLPTEGSHQEDGQLLLFPGKDVWWAFFSRARRLQVERVAAFASQPGRRPEPGQLHEIERGLAAALERSDAIGILDVPLLRLSLPPELATLDVHALEVKGRLVAERVPVAYTFAPHAALERATEEGAATVLVLGDPNADLPRAESEARDVASHFPGALALFGEQVTFDTVAKQLPKTQLLHFAGHARSGGVDGLDGALRLSESLQFSMGDVLALGSVPKFVVLSACTSGVSPEPGGGLSIGQAFLAAGSRAVVGASRPIADTLAQRFTRALYDRLLGSEQARLLPLDTHTWAAAVRGAALEVKRADGMADWASIRLLIP